jgi:hypothetical protein
MNSSSDKNIGEFCMIYTPKSKYIEKVGVKTIRAKIVSQEIKPGENIDKMISETHAMRGDMTLSMRDIYYNALLEG